MAYRCILSRYIKFGLLFVAVLQLYSCQIKEKAEQLQALKYCTYEVISADSVYLANIPVADLVSDNRLNLVNAPQLAFSYLRQQMPLKAVVNLKITNPNAREAAIDQFEYKVMIKDTDIISGSFNEPIHVDANGGTYIVPLRINQEIYPLISDPVNQSAVSGFLNTTAEKKATIAIKIKPAVLVGDKIIKYPDYITIYKEINNTALLSYLDGLYNQGG